jgi:hypothetical protein
MKHQHPHYEDPVVSYMKRHNIPVTRERYIDVVANDDEKWGAELEHTLPKYPKLFEIERRMIMPFDEIKAAPPVANDARLNAYLLGDRPRAAALSRQQHDPRPPHVALRRAPYVES